MAETYDMKILTGLNWLKLNTFQSRLQGFWTLSIAWYSKKNTFWRPGLFLSSGEGWETPTLLGLLGGANLNHWILT